MHFFLNVVKDSQTIYNLQAANWKRSSTWEFEDNNLTLVENGVTKQPQKMFGPFLNILASQFQVTFPTKTENKEKQEKTNFLQFIVNFVKIKTA